MAAHIDPLDRKIGAVSVRFRPGSENREISPFWTDGDTPSAVVRVVEVGASLVHVLPCLVEARSGASVGAASSSRRLNPKAAAAHALAAAQIGTADDAFSAALAETMPKRPTPRVIASLDADMPPAHGGIAQVDEARILGHSQYYDNIGGSASYGE